MCLRPYGYRGLLAGLGVGAALAAAPGLAFGQDGQDQTAAESAQAAAPTNECAYLSFSLQDHTPLGAYLEPLRFKVYGHIEQGFTANPDSPRDRQNFGRLFDDRANDYRLNQIMLTLDRPLQPQPDSFDWGGRVQVTYGSDARFIHYLGELDNLTNDTVQPNIVELYATFHLPVLTEGGLDVKAGQFVTLHGAEVIDATGNYLYSHTYMFNFAIPFKHTGFLATLHVTDWLDIHAGLVSGINTGFDDNNDAVSFHGGMLLTLFDGMVTVAPALHYGPENPSSIGPAADHDTRTIFDVVTTIKATDTLKFITDLNYGQDDFGTGAVKAQWYGLAQYAVLDVTDWLAVVARGEVFRDDDGFAVVQIAENDDLIDIQSGIGGGALDPRTVGGGATTYYALTLGLNLRPCEKLLIRPEIRYDWADNGSAPGGPFDDSSDGDQFTIGFDVIFSF